MRKLARPPCYVSVLTWRFLFILLRDIIEFRVHGQFRLTIPITFLQRGQF